MKTVIIAAGLGSRLWPRTDQIPKTLLPFGQGTILSQIMANFAAAGLRQFVIVVGFQGERIAEYLRAHGDFGYQITLVVNPEWLRGNGVSVHAAREAVGPDPFVLSMSDHLVSPPGLAALRASPDDHNLLLVDPRVDNVVHLDDATKVVMDGARILHIGKELSEFNAIDCGVFRLDARFLDAMGREIAAGRDSISQGVRALIAQGEFHGIPLPAGTDWVDIDTLEAYEYALAHPERLV